MNDRRLAVLMTGKEYSYELRPRNNEAEQPIALRVSNLSRAGEYTDVTFSIRAGEILGLTGLLGSGRTELALSLFGMTQPDSGTIELAGEAVTLRSNRDAIRKGVAYVPEDRLSLGLALEQPISSNILASTLQRLANSFGLIDPGRRRQEAETWISDLAIKVSNADSPVRTLSGGNQQRVVLAKWMACAPRLLILDSPTVGVDIGAKDGIYDLVRKLADRGIAVLMISDEVPEVFYHSHRILIMRNGRLMGEYNPLLSSESKVSEAVYA
jgi:simple sugar transport system ATP-binding protein